MNSESCEGLVLRIRDQDEDLHCLTIPEYQDTNQNQDTDQDHHCQTPSQEHVIHENLSLTPAASPSVPSIRSLPILPSK